MYTLRATDVKVADVSWITYYKKYLKDNGLKFDDRFEHRNPNKDALAYAESMTQTTQGANTEAGQAQIWEDWKNTAKIFLPYMSFLIILPQFILPPKSMFKASASKRKN